jgi:LruC domain-containing protein
MKSRSLRLAALAAALAGTGLLSGFTYRSGLIDWQYFGTPTGPYTYSLTDGSPTYAEFTRTLPPNLPAMPADLLTRVRYMLPEGRDIRQNAQGLIPDSDDTTNLRFAQEADVWVSFVSEGAGYRNSVGYFIYDQASPPRYPSEVAEKMIFANTSMPAPLDALSSTRQNTVYLGRLQAGQALGFVIVADGFSPTGRTVNGTRIPGVRDNVSPRWVFYTLRGLNPEKPSSQNLNVHSVMLKDLSDATPSYQRLILAFEDINRESGGDHDFNDVVLAVHVNPRTAIANIDAVQPLASPTDLDSDGDGVKDSLDEFPNDATRAFSRYYPTRDTYGTLAYEDLWPRRGDYDMNDMVMRYRSREILNAARQVVSLEVDYRFDARGASIDSGFGVQFPGIAAAAVRSASISVNGSAARSVTSEPGQTLATMLLFNSGQAELPGLSAACPFANTQAECGGVPSRSYRLTVEFNAAQPGASFSSPYNPFIFRTEDRGHEVHLPGKAPTALARSALFGTGDDRTAGNSTYVDGNGRPWALELPTVWKYPNETIDLTLPYPNMAAWASSAGAQYPEWYVSATVPKWLYIPR